MDRNLVSWTFANMVTVPLMAILGLTVFYALFQLGKKYWPGGVASTQGGY
jgi:hypothetical protein